MRDLKRVLLFIIVFCIAGYCFVNSDTTTRLESNEACCYIVINHTNKVVTYRTELGIDYESFDSPEEMDEIVNAMQEFCYSEHGLYGHEY